MATGRQYGGGIPHGRTDAVGRLVCTVGVKREGIDFDAIDGEPSRIFVLTLSPKSKPAPHVQFMSTVSQVLNESGRKRILAARGADEIYRVFTAPPQEAPAAPAEPMVPAPTGPFHLRQYLRAEAVEPHLKARTKEQAIVELLELLHSAGRLPKVRPAADAVLAREAQMATGMGEGVAIPHGRTNAVERLVCAVGVSRDGIDFGAVDGKDAQIVILVVTPEGGADPYVQFVGSLMSALDDEGREQALAAGTREELHEVLTRED
jgi:PTS system nitrogen regulatory IIA component